MGTSNSINDGVVTLKDAFMVIKRDSGYFILKSPLAYHDIRNKTITSETGIMESYELNHNSTLIEPPKGIAHYEYENLLMQVGEKLNFKAEKMTWDTFDDEN